MYIPGTTTTKKCSQQKTYIPGTTTKKVFLTKNFTRKRHQQVALKTKMTPTKNGLHKTTTPTTIKSQHRRQPTTSMIRRTKPALRQPKHLLITKQQLTTAKPPTDFQRFRRFFLRRIGHAKILLMFPHVCLRFIRQTYPTPKEHRQRTREEGSIKYRTPIHQKTEALTQTGLLT